MKQIKHVGKLITSGRRCVVVFRTLPNDPLNCLVVLSDTLTPSIHDAFFSVIDSEAGQSSSEIYDILSRSIFPDGSRMLQYLHVNNLLVKVPTAHVEMTPNASTSINLADLNKIIAKNNGTTVDQLWNTKKPQVEEVVKVQEVPESKESVAARVEQMENEAQQLLEQGNSLLAEVERLRKTLVPDEVSPDVTAQPELEAAQTDKVVTAPTKRRAVKSKA